MAPVIYNAILSNLTLRFCDGTYFNGFSVLVNTRAFITNSSDLITLNYRDLSPELTNTDGIPLIKI